MDSRPLSVFSFNEEAFEDRFNQLLTNTQFQENAKIIQEHLSNERDGVEMTIETILDQLSKQIINIAWILFCT